MNLNPKCTCGPCLQLVRNICLYSALECNHYKALGLNSSATHAEIKSAYYELSKKHHPDKNQGSEISAQKFRNITAAYEVLGNKESRKQYDREQGILRNSRRSVNQNADYGDEIERIIFERRRRASARAFYGKTPYYDFDAWYKAHYVDNNKFYKTEYYNVRSRYRYDRPHKETSQGDRKMSKREKARMGFMIYVLTLTCGFLIAVEMLPRK